ncbi:hypothetical protein SAMN05444392_101576 [Seinonella peptonophila]|uniref:Uncharacterized protein n=2 Tax=Seinonella peptonophila TaxID=112248 RepID=A0A1M4TPQ1_9BACL|nr:hypothetical protein SAMN05444392_101576 [Seinonella peptonophila]
MSTATKEKETKKPTLTVGVMPSSQPTKQDLINANNSPHMTLQKALATEKAKSGPDLSFTDLTKQLSQPGKEQPIDMRVPEDAKNPDGPKIGMVLSDKLIERALMKDKEHERGRTR